MRERERERASRPEGTGLYIRDLRAHVRKCGEDGREAARVQESVGESEPAGERETKGGREKEGIRYTDLIRDPSAPARECSQDAIDTCIYT